MRWPGAPRTAADESATGGRTGGEASATPPVCVGIDSGGFSRLERPRGHLCGGLDWVTSTFPCDVMRLTPSDGGSSGVEFRRP